MYFAGLFHRFCSCSPLWGISSVELTFYWVSDLGKLFKRPLIKFLSHSCSHANINNNSLSHRWRSHHFQIWNQDHQRKRYVDQPHKTSCSKIWVCGSWRHSLIPVDIYGAFSPQRTKKTIQGRPVGLFSFSCSQTCVRSTFTFQRTSCLSSFLTHF